MKIFKKIISSVLLLLVLFVGVTAVGCKDDGTTAKPDFVLNKTSFTMYVFETEILTLDTKSEEQVTWSCTNGALIKLTPDGKTVAIEAVRTGETTIMATQGKNSVSCKLVVFPPKQILAVTLNSALTAQSLVGGTYQFDTNVTVDGMAFTKANLEYRLTQGSPDGCVTVDKDGLVTAVSQGVAIVSVRAYYGDTYSEWVNVTVYSFSEDYDNDAEKAPSLDGGLIEDVFGE